MHVGSEQPISLLEAMRVICVAPKTALKYEVDVREHGHIEFQVSFVSGVRVVIFVVPEPQETVPISLQQR